MFRFSQPAVELFHTPFIKLKVDLSPSKCVGSWPPRGASPSPCARRLFWWPFSPHCEEKSKTRICLSKAHSKLCQAHACQSPPVQRRSLTSEHMRSPDLGHSAHIHEALESCGCMDFWRIPSGNVYHHFACHHENRASISFAYGSLATLAPTL